MRPATTTPQRHIAQWARFQTGDTVASGLEVEIKGVGVLPNPVVAAP